MSRREDFDNGLWSRPDFASLSPDAKLTYVWSWGNPRCNMAGLYACREGAAAFDIGYSIDRERGAFNELQEARFVYFVDGVIWVRSRVRDLRTRGGNMAKSIERSLLEVPAGHPLRDSFVAENADLVWLADALEKAKSENPSKGSDGVPGLGLGQGQGLGPGHVERNVRSTGVLGVAA